MSAGSTSDRDRRRFVRVRPTAEYTVRVDLMRGIVCEPLDIVDLSVGGIGLLLSTPLSRVGVGSVIKLRVTTPRTEPFNVQAIVRHISVGFGICGVEFQQPDEPVLTALRHAVGELLQRGSLA